MHQSCTTNSILLEHNYSCFKESEVAVSEEFFEDFLSFLPPNMDAELEFSFDSKFPASSPAYSTDSGIDSVYADLTWDFDSFNFREPAAQSNWIGTISEEKPIEPRGDITMNSNCEKKQAQLPGTSFPEPNKKLVPIKYTSEEDILQKNRKNAEAARENRQKKKRYLEGLEKENEELKAQNDKISSENHGLKDTVSALKEEVSYLRSVIANQGTLSLLLKSIASTPGISLTTSFAPSTSTDEETSFQADNNQKENRRTGLRKRKGESSEDDGIPANKKRSMSKDSRSGGVCLHVSKERVSLEFCAKCSQNAKAAWN